MNLSGLFLANELGIYDHSITRGWRSWLWILLGNNILPISVASLLQYFNSLHQRRYTAAAKIQYTNDQHSARLPRSQYPCKVSVASGFGIGMLPANDMNNILG